MMTRQRPPEQANGPVRTCLGCGKKLLKMGLLRFVAGHDGLVAVDLRRCLPGRGVYCCPGYKCLASFMGKKGKILRGLRISKVDCSGVLSLVDEYRFHFGD